MEHTDTLVKMMAGSLGLEEPWYIAGAEFDEKELALHIRVGIRKAAAVACPRCGAEARRNSLYSWMRRCRLKPMKDAAETLKPHRKKILACFKNRVTNAICEGINSMIQAARRKARGFRTFEGYSSMIYLVAGKLQLAVPRPF